MQPAILTIEGHAAPKRISCPIKGGYTYSAQLIVRTVFSFALVFAACADGTERLDASTRDGGQLEAPSKPRMVRWVGAVEDSDVRVAILVGPGEARLFFCGGAESYATTTLPRRNEADCIQSVEVKPVGTWIVEDRTVYLAARWYDHQFCVAKASDNQLDEATLDNALDMATAALCAPVSKAVRLKIKKSKPTTGR